MDGFHKRKKRFKFTERKHSGGGIFSFVMSIILIIVHIVFIALSYKQEGNLSVYFGSAGVFCMVVSVFLLIPIIGDLRNENSFSLFPRLALGLDIVAMLLWISTYVRGFLA